MKKKILFVLNQMGSGGIAKSLSNLLFHLEKYKDEYEVDLFLLRKDGCYMNDIPNYVNVMESRGVLKLFGSSQRDTKKFGFGDYIARFFVAGWAKLFSNYMPLKIGVKQNKMTKEYDAAISFTHTQGGHNMAAGSVEFVLDGVKAKKKIVVMHGDPIVEKLLFKGAVKNLKKFDKVYNVSQSCMFDLQKSQPQLKEISDYLYNTQRNDIILEQSNSEKRLYQDGFNMVMVSRLEHQKAHMRFLPIIKRLHDEGFDFNLNIVGDGSLKEDIKDYIDRNNMNEYVYMHGQQSNPFPFMKQADLFVLASYWESWGMVLTESMLLKVPVFSTKTCPAEEVVGDLGFVCDNSEEGIYNGLKEVLNNMELIKEKKDKLKNYNYDNDAIVKKLLNEINK